MQNVIEIIKIIQPYFSLVTTLLVAFFGIKSVGNKLLYKILIVAMKWIKELEAENTITGEEKMELVVSYMKDRLPKMFKIIYNDKVIEYMAQTVYNDMKTYSENRVIKKTGLNWTQMVEAVKTVTKEQEDTEIIVAEEDDILITTTEEES